MQQLSDIEQEVVKTVEEEVSSFKEPEVFITENVSFSMRPLIRRLRKNYYGVYDQPKDKATGRKKIWSPITMVMCDAVTKNIDLDTKDILFRNKNKDSAEITDIVRATVKDYLDRSGFGQDLDLTLRTLAIDPVVVWKTQEVTRNGKTTISRKLVDVLNVFIDPSADSIQDAYRFTERVLMTKEEMEKQKGWKNVELAQPRENYHKYDARLTNVSGTSKLVDVYEMWGKVPEYFFTGNRKDTNEVDARVVVSGLEGGKPILHLIEKNTKTDNDGNVIKPYEELWYRKLPWSWYGISPAWMVLDMQEYGNTILNVRANKAIVSQLGLFKLKNSAGVSQADFSKLVSNGVIKLANTSDLEVMQIPEPGVSSYKDEEVAKLWASELTNAFDAVRGHSLPATATATGVVTEDRNAKSAYVLVKDAIGFFLERWIDRHVLTVVPKMIREKKYIRVESGLSGIEKLRQRIVSHLAMQYLEDAFAQGRVPSETELLTSMDRAERKLSGDLFFEVVEDIITNGLDTDVQITNEEMDVAVTVQNLLALMPMIPEEARRDTLFQVFDLLGLERPQIDIVAAPQMLDTQGMTEQQMVTQANVR